MYVHLKVLGERHPPAPREVDVAPGKMTAGELIDRLVQHEVAQYDERRSQRTLQVLTPADLAEGVDSGSYVTDQRPRRAAPPIEEAVRRAREAYEDELFYLFIDDQRIESLSQVIEIGDHTAVRLVRLVALAGG